MKKIAIVTGGFTSEYSVSLKSARNVLNVIDRAIFEPYWIEITPNKWVCIHENQEFSIDKNDFSFIMNEKKIQIDAVFLIIHGIPGENGSLQGYFQLINMPFVGPNLLSAALTMNKIFTNKLLKSFNFFTANSILFNKKENVDLNFIEKELKFPLFIKPNDGGSSFGVSKVKNKNEIQAAIEKALLESETVLIEEAIEGKEYSGGVSDFSGNITALSFTEIIFQGEFFDFEAKYKGKSEEITPARLPAEKTEKYKNTLKNIYEKLNLTGTVRIDFIIEHRTEHLYVIEINSIPGMTNESMINKQLDCDGISLNEFVNKSLKKLF